MITSLTVNVIAAWLHKQSVSSWCKSITINGLRLFGYLFCIFVWFCFVLFWIDGGVLYRARDEFKLFSIYKVLQVHIVFSGVDSVFDAQSTYGMNVLGLLLMLHVSSCCCCFCLWFSLLVLYHCGAYCFPILNDLVWQCVECLYW